MSCFVLLFCLASALDHSGHFSFLCFPQERTHLPGNVYTYRTKQQQQWLSLVRVCLPYRREAVVRNSSEVYSISFGMACFATRRRAINHQQAPTHHGARSTPYLLPRTYGIRTAAALPPPPPPLPLLLLLLLLLLVGVVRGGRGVKWLFGPPIHVPTGV